MFILLLICLYNAKPAMGYDLLCVPSMSMSTPIRKLEKNLKNTNKFFESRGMGINFPEASPSASLWRPRGGSPSHARVTPGSVSKWQGGLG